MPLTFRHWSDTSGRSATNDRSVKGYGFVLCPCRQPPMLNRRSLRGSGDAAVEKIASTSASVMLRQSPRSSVVSDIVAHWTSRVTE
jgi:hypothetical protein